MPAVLVPYQRDVRFRGEPTAHLPGLGFRLTWPRVAAIGLAAIAIRLIYILVIARAPVGVGGDAGFYHSAANLIAHGHFYDREIFGHAYKTAEHPPLFSMLLSLSSLLGGDSLLAHRIVGCAIGSCAVVLIALLGRRIGGDRVGLLAGLLAAVYPPLITADGLVMSEPLFVLLVAGALLLALHALSHPSVGAAAALGVVIGLAILTRGEGLLLVPLLLWPAAYARGARRSPRVGPARLAPAAGRLARIAAASAAVALVLAPWVIRNALVFDRFMIAADSSTVIAGANCRETYYGHDIGWWSNACLERARTRTQLLQGDASTSAATRFARHHLARLSLVAAVRVLRTFNFFQPLRQGNRELRRRWLDVVGLIIYFPVLVLAILGAIRLPARRWVLLAPVWMVLIVSVAGWGIGRFRVGADVALIVLAAYYIAGHGRARSRRRSTIAAMAVR
jgi:4-amino-4-deoxy-L-arabinose transferase-like glycosyltransferase